MKTMMNLAAAIRLVVQINRWRRSVQRRRNRPDEIVIPESVETDTEILRMYHEVLMNFKSEETETEIPRRTHEVFLSFRGKDTRASFISHLNQALQNAAIKVFKDDDSMERGNIISDSLFQAIEESEISVVVFSISYADSPWCLEELAKIMDWRRTKGQVVLPVFYHLDPSEVRHQSGEFGNAFQNLLKKLPEEEHYWLSVEEEKEQQPLCQYLEQRWRVALREAAGLAGFVVLNSR